MWHIMNYENKIVSIIIPLYNSENFFSETIESILNQTYKNIEVIIVDDCSTDNSFRLAAAFMFLDARIKLIKNVKNSGPGLSRLNGLRLAKGAFIAFIDSDDVWQSNKLAIQLDFMSKYDIKFSYTAFRRFSSNENRVANKLGRLISVPEFMSYKDLLSNTAIATSTVIISRDIFPDLEGINTSKIYIEDYVLFFSMLKKGVIAGGLNIDLMRYRVQKNSFSRNKFKYAFKVWRTYREVECLTILQAFTYFSRYALRGFLKYLRF